MTGRTHALAGVASLWLVAWIPGFISGGSGFENLGLIALSASVGALMPDLDAPVSLLTKQKVLGITPFAVPSHMIRSVSKHRGILHSFVGMGVVCLLICPLLFRLLSWQTALAFAVGYLSHLYCDCLTVTGLRILYPRQKTYWTAPKRLRIPTGGPWEEVYFAVFGMLAFYLLWLHLGL